MVNESMPTMSGHEMLATSLRVPLNRRPDAGCMTRSLSAALPPKAGVQNEWCDIA
jgi:hypothetical protein